MGGTLRKDGLERWAKRAGFGSQTLAVKHLTRVMSLDQRYIWLAAAKNVKSGL